MLRQQGVPKRKGRSEHLRWGGCDGVCGVKELASNIVIIPRERNKESVMMCKVKQFPAFRSKDLNVCTALDFLKMQCGMGERRKKQNCR